jgi:hypothetical protein
MTKYWLLGLIVLVGCQNHTMYEPVWDELEFEWVEPVIFQQNWIRCRSEPVCIAETLFE